MIDFITSLSWIGWVLIALAAFTLWQLPTIIRNWRNRPADDRKLQPGEDPPTNGTGWY
ncbi:hypothetical protein KUV51_16375 [Tateyamaria omphalii]|uniref:hypothetical protein n=1 Tax=Tateyamaria omphalii TaxID=299262 RepID=UPI001C99C903|nr:hypothetical protein [Tateyamaria omphalii]MBY5934586.1 hypothetical protein [Tateyamaria omphalii]